MKRWIQSPWTAALLGTVVYIVTLVAAWQPQARRPAPSLMQAGSRSAAGAWATPNPEMDLLLDELKQQKELLASKEKELKDLATRLQTERNELTQLTQTVYQIQSEFDQNVTRVRQEETANLKKLAKLYASMSPDGAAAVFKSLDDATLVKVLTFMRDSERAPILEVLARQSSAEAKRVATLSERLRLTVAEAKK